MKPGGAVLVDTNILVYAYQPAATQKMRAAKDLLRSLWSECRGSVSVQNLTEFCSVSLTRMRPPIPPRELSAVIGDLSRAFRVLAPDAGTVSAALGGVVAHGLSFWDAMIWAVAKQNGVVEILSEDFQSGRDVEGVLFTNPFGSSS